VVEGAVLEFLRGCRVHGNAGLLSPTNAAATAQAPIGYRKPGRDKALYIGLHLETDDPEALIALCQASAAPAGSSVKRAVRSQRALTRAPSPRHRRTRSTPGQHSGGCR
jgi:hypothetical protein